VPQRIDPGGLRDGGGVERVLGVAVVLGVAGAAGVEAEARISRLEAASAAGLDGGIERLIRARRQHRHLV
ncbi:hypothetical protein OFC03_30960, partial [Escherichia coli]|nr:hypothetical protein [Escherichia coli]